MTREKQINPKTLDDELDDELEIIEDELDDELESISDNLEDELDDELEDELEPVNSNLTDDLDDDIIEETTPLDLEDNLDDNIDNGTNIVNDKYESKSAFDNAIKEFSLNQFMTVKELEDELGEDEITDGINVSDIEDELEEEEQEEKVVQSESPNVQSAKFRRLERHRALSTSLVTAIESVQERFRDTDKLISTYSNSVDLGIRMVTSSNRELASKYRFNGMPKILNDNLPNIWGHLQQIKSAGKEINVEEIMSTPLETIIRRQTSYSNLCLYDALKNGFEEAIAINLLTAIKDNIDYDYQQRREKKLKHDSIVEKYKQRYFHDMQGVRKVVNSLNEDNTVLVKRVSTDLTEYICGNPECKDEFIVADNKIAIFANLSVRNSSICLFNPNVCPHCGKINILSAEEMRRLDFAYRNGKEEIFLQLSNFMTSRTSGYSCSTYGLPDYIVESEIPNIAELVEEPVIEEQKPIMILDCFEAIDRYLGMLKFFDNQTIETGELVSQSDNIIKELLVEPKDNEEVSTGIVDELEDELDTVESSIENTDSLQETALTQDNSSLSDKDKLQRIALNKTVEFYGSIAKLASTSVSRDYKELKINAISSLIYHFESTNYGDYLKSSPLIYMEGLYKSKSILNEIGDLNDGEFGQLLNDIESAFKSYDIDIEVGKTREETITNLSKCFDMMKPKIEEFKELRDIHVRKIINRHLELSTLYISNFTIDWNTVTDYVSNPETARLIDLITDTMIISLVAEDYYYLLFSGLKDKDIARLKDFAGKADEYYKKTTDYMIKSDIITGIDKFIYACNYIAFNH
ncbi:hypothetical protein, partial [Paraclostridium bifermentans]|uniref:hypothetical protein n=1 Tax=Paraclostridium bifermentans TaxID=1490 RepID=UPI00374E805E